MNPLHHRHTKENGQIEIQVLPHLANKPVNQEYRGSKTKFQIVDVFIDNTHETQNEKNKNISRVYRILNITN